MRAQHHFDCCLGPDEGVNPLRTAGNEGQAFSVIRLCRRRYQKSPLRRCFKPRSPWRAGCAGFASGCRSHEQGSESSSLGGCPASCPDTHRSTHGHRHVRNWAFNAIRRSDRESTLLVQRGSANNGDLVVWALSARAATGFLARKTMRAPRCGARKSLLNVRGFRSQARS
jgi:hypothetical protein